MKKLGGLICAAGVVLAVGGWAAVSAPAQPAKQPTDADLNTRVMSRFADLFGAVRTRLIDAVDRGEVHDHIDPDRLVELIGGATLLPIDSVVVVRAVRRQLAQIHLWNVHAPKDGVDQQNLSRLLPCGASLPGRIQVNAWTVRNQLGNRPIVLLDLHVNPIVFSRILTCSNLRAVISINGRHRCLDRDR